MKRVSTFVAIALSYPLLAQQTASFTASDKIVIEHLLDRYVRAFSAKDYATLRECFQAPWVGFPGPVRVLQTVDDVIAAYKNQLDALDSSNYDPSQFLRTRITVLASDKALVNKTYRRYRKSGTVLQEAAGIYVVSKSSGTWKICGFLPQDLQDFGKIY